MGDLRALIVNAAPKMAADIAESLQHHGVPADSASTAADAVALLEAHQYSAVLLDDSLPAGGSIEVYEAMHRPDVKLPELVLITVPPELLATAESMGDQGIEYVPLPQNLAQVDRLALKLRTRLIRTGLEGEFQRTEKREHAQAEPQVRLPSVVEEQRGLLTIVATAVLLLTLLLVLRVTQQPEATGPKGALPARPSATVVYPVL